MSVHRRGKKWQVKWREDGQQRSQTFDRKRDADLREAEIRRAKQLGPRALREVTARRDEITLRAFTKTGFRTHSATLAAKTRRNYVWALEHHLGELLDLPLVEIDVPRIAEHQLFLADHGRSVATIRGVIKHLSGILQVATEHGLIQGNPARAVRKPLADVRDEITPLSPVELEAIIAALSGRERIMAVLAGHLGLRPLELRLVLWSALTEGTLMIGRAQTKRTAARTRVITVPAATMLELKRWRLESGRPDDDQPIIGPMTQGALHNWASKRLRAPVKAITGRDDATLYTLRHTHASLLHYCGHTVPSAAKRMGHDGITHLQTYAHVVEALEGQPRYADLDALIAAARAQLEADRAVAL
jgi:integrase